MKCVKMSIVRYGEKHPNKEREIYAHTLIKLMSEETGAVVAEGWQYSLG